MNTLRIVVVLWAGGLLARAAPGSPMYLRWAPVAGMWLPGPATVVALAGLARDGWRHRVQRRRATRDARADVDVLAELVLLGLSAGLTPGAALERAGSHVDGPLRDEVAFLLRRSRMGGMAVELRAAGGVGAPLYRLLARSIDGGAPLEPALEAFADDAIDRRRADGASAARRLPVHLLFPLTLLVLPGFVLLTAAPALLGAARRVGL